MPHADTPLPKVLVVLFHDSGSDEPVSVYSVHQLSEWLDDGQRDAVIDRLTEEHLSEFYQSEVDSGEDPPLAAQRTEAARESFRRGDVAFTLQEVALLPLP